MKNENVLVKYFDKISSPWFLHFTDFCGYDLSLLIKPTFSRCLLMHIYFPLDAFKEAPNI